MCAAALAQLAVGRVVFGCMNDKFGGCGSILSLHREEGNGDEGSSGDGSGFPTTGGVLEDDAIALLRAFYNRENFRAPDDKRRRKDGKEPTMERNEMRRCSRA
jgi:tRNA-specific adenosine deaminase 2